MATEDLFYSEETLKNSAFARVLLTGPQKAGKTTAILTTAPGPICVLNCDGEGAPMAAKRHGAKDLLICDVSSVALWERGVAGAVKLANEGKVKSIVVDTITLLINDVLSREFSRRYSGFDIWRETLNSFLQGFDKLKAAPAHLFLPAHHDLSDGQVAVDGKLKGMIPGLVHDIVHLDFNPKRDPARAFHVGPSASGLSGSRNCDENKVIPANVRELLALLGYEE